MFDEEPLEAPKPGLMKSENFNMNEEQASKNIFVRFNFTYEDIGCESLCDELLAQPTTLGRARLLREILLDCFRKRGKRYSAPTEDQINRWLVSSAQIKIGLTFNADDPTISDLYKFIADLPDNKSRVLKLRRMIHANQYLHIDHVGNPNAA